MLQLTLVAEKSSLGYCSKLVTVLETEFRFTLKFRCCICVDTLLNVRTGGKKIGVFSKF